MKISDRKAWGQMRIAETLRDRVPGVGELYRRGRLSTRVVGAITWRTRLITDGQVWALIDTALSGGAQQWGPRRRGQTHRRRGRVGTPLRLGCGHRLRVRGVLHPHLKGHNGLHQHAGT